MYKNSPTQLGEIPQGSILNEEQQSMTEVFSMSLWNNAMYTVKFRHMYWFNKMLISQWPGRQYRQSDETMRILGGGKAERQSPFVRV